MKILMASPWAPPAGGGLERYASSLTAQLQRAGHEVHNLGHGERLPPQITLSNTPISLAIHREARRILREARPDIVHVHTPVPGTAELVAHAARRAHVPYVVTYHAGTLGAPAGWLSVAARLHAATFERRMLAGAAAHIAVSPFVAAHALRKHPSQVIAPGVDIDKFRPSGAPTPGRVLFVGPVSRAYAWKGVDVLAAAVRLVPGAHLRIVGEGDLADRYRRAGASVVGRVSDARLVHEYGEASVVVLPSISAVESFGMVLAEANACARPVIGSDIGGIPSFVRPGENGWLVPPGDARALADAIRAVLADPERAARMGAAGRARVERDHQWSGIAARTLAVYEQALTGA